MRYVAILTFPFYTHRFEKYALELIRVNQTNTIMAFVRDRLTNGLAGGSGGTARLLHIIASLLANCYSRERSHSNPGA
jgi:hypothetical protein